MTLVGGFGAGDPDSPCGGAGVFRSDLLRSGGFGSLDDSVDTPESYPEHMSDAADVPELPRSLRAPEPVIAVGMTAWLIAAIVVGVTGWGGGRTLAVCLVGLGVGVLGTSIFLIQRAASRRGDRTAQRGLD